jgi:hypothetical protein
MATENKVDVLEMIAHHIKKTLQTMNKEERKLDNEDRPDAIIGSRRGSDEHTLLTTTTSITLPMHSPML